MEIREYIQSKLNSDRAEEASIFSLFYDGPPYRNCWFGAIHLSNFLMVKYTSVSVPSIYYEELTEIMT